MPTQPPHHVSRQEFQNPHPPRSVEPYYAKRTLNKTHATGVPPLYLTPVFQPGSSHTPKTQNEPNFSRAGRIEDQKCETNPISTTRFYKTNPISARPTPKMRNEPNLAPPASPIMRNEPNSSIPSVQPPDIYAKRTQFQPRRTCGGPKNTKRTQFQPRRTKY